jgi:OFA family oxalate/formate antiporter-like MFS transporter
LSSKLKEKLFYGWVIVFATMFITLIIMGTRFSFGVFFKPLANEFDLSRATTSSPFSIYMVLCALATLASGWVLDRYGPRLVFLIMGLFTGLSLLLTSQINALWQLYLSYSLLLSIGTAAFVPVMNVTVSRWFEKKRGLAIGITSSGSRLGQVVYAPFCAFLISHFGWRMAYIVTGLVAWLLVVPASRLVRNDPREIGALPDGVKLEATQLEEKGKEEDSRLSGLSLSQALRTKNYWFFTSTWLFLGFGNMLVWTHIVPYATDANVTAIEASTILSVMGGLALPAGILFGKISDIKGRKTPLVILALLRAGVLIGLIWAHELWMFYIFAISFGISIGGTSVVIAALSVDIFGKRSIGVFMGTFDMLGYIGSAIGAFTGGLVYDVSNSYALAFIIASVGNIILAILMALVKIGVTPERV